MSEVYEIKSSKLAKALADGGVGVLPTDTLYGLVCSAAKKKSVEHVYKLRERNLRKPSIILISSVKDLDSFCVKLDERTRKILSKVWPGKVSVILPCTSPKFAYLHRGTKSLAFRLPKKTELVNLIRKTGPIIAPSANLEGLLPATTVKEAREYFEDTVNFYVPGGRLYSLPSTIISIMNGKVSIKRQGAEEIKI